MGFIPTLFVEILIFSLLTPRTTFIPPLLNSVLFMDNSTFIKLRKSLFVHLQNLTKLDELELFKWFKFKALVGLIFWRNQLWQIKVLSNYILNCLSIISAKNRSIAYILYQCFWKTFGVHLRRRKYIVKMFEVCTGKTCHFNSAKPNKVVNSFRNLRGFFVIQLVSSTKYNPSTQSELSNHAMVFRACLGNF